MENLIDARHLERLPILVWRFDPVARRFTDVQGTNLLGHQRARWLQPGFFETSLHPQDRDRIGAAFAEAVATGEDAALEYRMISAGGELVWVHNFVRDDPAEREGLCGVMVDVTQCKQATVQREAIEARLRSVFDSFDGVIGVMDASGRLLDVRGRGLAGQQALKKPWRGRPVEEILGPSLTPHRDKLRRALAGETLHYTSPSRSNPGQHEAITLSPVLGADRMVTGVIGVFTDDTARVQAEEALRVKNALFETLMNAAPDGIVITGPDGAVLAANRRFQELWPPGLPVDDGAADGTGELTTAAGRLLERRSAPVVDALGTLRGQVWFVRDVTDERQLEQQLREADRLSSLGVLAAGIAHEVNNPLACILNGVELVLSQLLNAQGPAATPVDLPSGIAALRVASAAVDHVSQIARKLKGFSVPRREEPHVEVRPQTIIADALRITGHELNPRARVVLRESSGVGRVRGAPGELVQVVVNLLLNAAQAIPAGARDDHQVEVGLRQRDGRVELWVRDTGCGMTPEVRERVFEPFFTTKSPDVGTGLGLAVCEDIVCHHGGTIEVESAPGAGATFRVSLPAVDLPQPEAAPAGADPGSQRGSDRPAVRPAHRP